MSHLIYYNLKRYEKFQGLHDLRRLEKYNLESAVCYRWQDLTYRLNFGRLEPLDLCEGHRMKATIKNKRQININDEIGKALFSFWKDLKVMYSSYKSLEKDQVVAIYKLLSDLLYHQEVKHKYLISWIFELAECSKSVRKYLVQEDSKKINFILYRLLSRDVKLNMMERFKNYLCYNKCFWSLYPEQLKVLLQNGIKLKIDLKFINSNLHRHFNIRRRTAKRRVTKKYHRKRLVYLCMMYNTFMLPEADKIRCLANMRLIWKTIPQPFLTSAEIKKTLFYVSTKAQQPDIDRVCLEYDREFSSPVPRPRSLQHYARCTIRSLLDHRNPLTKAIDILPISEKCLPYLRLDV